MSRKISVELVGDSRSVVGAFKRSGTAARGFDRDITRSARGAVAASLSFRGLGRAAFFASSYLLGGAGLVVGLKDVTQAAVDHQTVEKQLVAAVRATGLQYGANARAINDVVKAEEQLGFSEQDSTRAFILGLRATKSVIGAKNLLAKASNVARGRNMDLVSSEQLLVRVQAGQVGSLRRLGIIVQKGISGRKALIAVEKQYAGAATAYAEGAAGSQDRLGVAIHANEILIGDGLLPTITKLSGRLADWLSNTKNQERIQRDVNKVVHDTGAIVQAASAAIKGASHAVGGFTHLLEILLGLKLGSKFVNWSEDVGLFDSKVTKAAKRTGILNSRLGALASIGTITVTLLVLEKLIPSKITKGGQKILNSEGLGGLGKIPIIGPLAVETGAYFGRQVGKAVGLNYGGSSSGGVPKQYASSPQSWEAYYAGKSGEPFPYSFTAPGASVWLEAYLAGRKAGGKPVRTTAPPAATNTATAAKPKAALDRLSKLQDDVAAARLAVSRGTRGSQQQLIAALRQQIGYDETYAKVQEKLVARGGADAKKHAKTLQALLADEASTLDEIAGITKQAGDARTARERKQRDALRAAAAKRAARRVADQYRALGLTASGDTRAPSVKHLRASLGSLSDAVQGTFLDTKKTESIISHIRKVLAGGLGAVGRDVRLKIQEILDGLDQQLKDHARNQTKFTHASTAGLLAGLGLSPDEIRRLRPRLAQIGVHGTAPGQRSAAFAFAGDIHTTVQLDGKTIAKSTAKHQSGRRTISRRG